MSKAYESLERLVCSGKCNCQTVGEYRYELQSLSRKVSNEVSVRRKGKVFKALGDDTRLKILALLMIRDMCVCELMTALDMTQPSTSHHLKILESADLVHFHKDGRWVFYGVNEGDRLASLLGMVV